ncbi:MAG: DUF2397 family protein [Pirellulales bacterium]|nr:DUF2397 family protein [Pirellulales bacterium]
MPSSMSLWEYPIREISSRLDCRQWEFLTVPMREVYLAVLVTLYRARQQETLHELPFDVLYDRLTFVIDELKPPERFDATALRATLNRLEAWGNVAMRLEPRRVRTITDRGLKLLLVRLSESTNTILEHLESQLEEIEHQLATSARFSLLEVDDALQMVISVLENKDISADEDYCRAGRELFRARRAVEDAGDELLRLDLWLSETAVQTPDRQRLVELLTHLETYFDRYLQQVDARRERCYEKLGTLVTNQANGFLVAVENALQREFAEDPTRAGRRAPEIRPLLQIIQDFLKPEGILDYRRMVVHQRLADVAGHLRRYLAELVRRSQLVASLRTLSGKLLQAPEERIQREVDAFFLRLWQPAQAVLDENSGVPTDRALLPRPYIYRPTGKRRFAGASIQPSSNGHPKSSRPTLIKQMDELNAFVMKVVLHGQREAFIEEAVLENFGHVRLLLSAIRMAWKKKTQLQQRYLRYQVARPTVDKQVMLRLPDGSVRWCRFHGRVSLLNGTGVDGFELGWGQIVQR